MARGESILAQLEGVIAERKSHPLPTSYTNQLMAGGVERISAKIAEEANELCEAAAALTTAAQRAPVVHEAADLLYHTLVLLGFCDVSLAEVELELARRFGTSGLDEKAQRGGYSS